MAKLQIKKSNETGKVPQPSDLDWGELALNYTDGKLFYKKHGTNTVELLNPPDTNTVTRLRGTTSGTYTSGDLTLVAGTNITVTQSGSEYTIASAGGADSTKLPLTGGTLTGTLNFNSADQSAILQHDGTAVAWYGRLLVKNATADISSFLGNYNSKAGVFAHNNALTAWAPLYVNTLGNNGEGTVYLPHNATYTLSGDNTAYAILNAGNYNSYAPTLTGTGASGTWGISVTGSAASAASATTVSRGSGNIANVTAPGSGTYNQHVLYATNTEFGIEAALATDSLAGNKLPLVFSWRGGYDTLGGLKITGASSAQLGGNAVLHAANYNSYALPLAGGTLTGTLTGVSGPTLSFSAGTCAADSYNYVLAAANDSANRLVIFVNGSARSADGGTNSVTIRNDAGVLNLGSSSYTTNLIGSSVTTTTATAGTNTTQVATTQFVQTAIANLVNTAPSTLDTLNELAAALGNDPNFATTVTNSLANKLSLTGGTLTGALTINANDGVKAVYGGTDGQTWLRGWGLESDRGAVYIRGTGNASQTLRIGYSEGSQSWATVRVDTTTFTHNGNTIWTAGNDGSGSGLDADLLDGLDSSSYWTKSGSWWGAGFTGSRLQGVSANGGEFVLIQDHPNTGQISVLVDGAYIAGENNGFWMTPGNNWNTRYGFYWNGSQIDFRQGTAPVVFGGFVGIGGSFGSDDGNWGARLNVGGAPHARIDARCSNDGIVTTMYSHQGQNSGKMGTMSDHRLALMANGSEYISVLTNGNVGIGNNSPAVKLDIQDTGRSGSTYTTGTVFYATSAVDDLQFIGQFRHQNQSQGIGFSYNSIRQTGSNTNEQISLCSRGTGNLNLRYGSTDTSLGTIGLMLLGTNGNVGIGTSSPTKRLEVKGTANGSVIRASVTDGAGSASFGYGFYIDNTAHEIAQIVANYVSSGNSGYGGLKFNVSNNGLYTLMTLEYTGKVGIGIETPSEKLEVNGNILAFGSASNTAGAGVNIWLGPANNSRDIGIRRAGTAVMAFDRYNGGWYENARFHASGNFSIGNANDNGYKLEVNGSFAATTKSFVINHPTKPGKKLRYGSLEGPENGVYVRGRLRGTKIELPDYWTKLVDPDSITVQLTPHGRRQDVWVTKIENNCVYVQGTTQPDCYYFIQAERVDVEKLQVELDA